MGRLTVNMPGGKKTFDIRLAGQHAYNVCVDGESAYQITASGDHSFNIICPGGETYGAIYIESMPASITFTGGSDIVIDVDTVSPDVLSTLGLSESGIVLLCSAAASKAGTMQADAAICIQPQADPVKTVFAEGSAESIVHAQAHFLSQRMYGGVSSPPSVVLGISSLPPDVSYSLGSAEIDLAVCAALAFSPTLTMALSAGADIQLLTEGTVTKNILITAECDTGIAVSAVAVMARLRMLSEADNLTLDAMDTMTLRALDYIS